MMYYICASPLVKIYLPEWHDRLLANPDLIYDDETPFEFNIRRGMGGIKVKFNTPQQIPPKLARDNKELMSLYNWLTGGPNGTDCQETEIYGIVVFDPKINLIETYDQISMLEDLASEDSKKAMEARKRQNELQRETARRVKETREKVRALSEMRIKRQLRFNHNNLIRQWQMNEENKLGKYPPSITEMLGAHALNKEIAAADEKGKILKSKMSDLMRSTQVV